MRKLWTEEENNIIKSLKARGLTYKQIQIYLPHRTMRAIAVQGAKILPSAKPNARLWSAEEEQQLINMRSENISYKNIAEKLNRSYTSVKTKGSYLITSNKPLGAKIMSAPDKLRDTLSDLTIEEREYIETGQFYLDL